MQTLAPDVVLMADGGGLKQAALRQITSADKVTRYIVGGSAGHVLTTEFTVVNGHPALELSADGEFEGVIAIRPEEGRITGLYYVRNPAKLSYVATETALERR